MIDADRIPLELRLLPRWVIWREEQRAGKATKVPYVPSRPALRASSIDPSTWDTFQVAFAAFEDGKADGIGIVLGEGLGGVDLDSCRDPLTGRIAEWAEKIIRGYRSYTEISPSGHGVKIFACGAPPNCRQTQSRSLIDMARTASGPQSKRMSPTAISP